MGTSRVTVSGPLWNGQADAAITRWIEATKIDLANQAQAIVKSKAKKMNRSGRGGTGRAADAVIIRASGSVRLVEGRNDKGVVWWPWLEGTSRRNTTTRFRGYHAFRLARNVTAKRAREIAQDKLNEYISQMGGHS